MQITDYFSLNGQHLTFTRQQASDFAKKIANDFNPIHDPDHKRFCVPGDLLFAVMIHHYGLSQQMHFKFTGMVDDSKTVILTECDGDSLEVKDDKDKSLLNIQCSGGKSTNAALIAALSESYVQFSGQTFPHVLVPLMRDNNVMINPDRPLVIYNSMSLTLDTLDIEGVSLEFDSSTLTVDGKRGNVTLNYVLKSGDKAVGKGQKTMMLSGLREYDAEKMDSIVAFYNERKATLG